MSNRRTAEVIFPHPLRGASHADATNPAKVHDQQVFHLDKALARVDGDRALLRELADLFAVDCPRMMDTIQAAIRRGNSHARRGAAHTLKGSLGIFNADPAYEAALQLETMDDQQTLADVELAYTRFEAEIQRLMPALQKSWLEDTCLIG